MHRTFDIDDGIPHADIEDLADIREWIDSILSSAKDGEIGDMDDLCYRLRTGHEDYTCWPKEYVDEDSGERWSLAGLLQFSSDRYELDLCAQVIRGDARDVAIMEVQFGILLVLVAAATNRKPRTVEIVVGAFEGGPEPAYGPPFRLVVSKRVAGRGPQTIEKATADDFDIVGVDVSAAV